MRYAVTSLLRDRYFNSYLEKIQINIFFFQYNILYYYSSPTWFISSTHLKGHLASSCSAIMYSTVDTLLSPPLWWCWFNSRSGSASRNFTFIPMPYLLYSSCNTSCTSCNSLELWATSWQNQQNDCVPRKLGSLATQWAHSKDWSDWAEVDLSLCWAHRSVCWFCHVTAY